MPTKVVHILKWLKGGGVEQRRHLLARHLPAEEFDQTFLALEHDYGWRERFEKEDVSLRCLPSKLQWAPFDWRGILEVASHLRDIDPDIVHGAVFEGVSMAALAGTLAGCDNIIIEEIGDPSVRRWKGHLLTGLYARLASHCVGVSQPVTDYFVDTLKVSPDKVHCVENGVRDMQPPTAEKRRQLRRKWGIGADDFVVGSVGRLDDNNKRYSTLIDVIARLREDHEHIKLLLVGDGPDRQQLENHAAQRNLAEEVIFTGFQNDVEDLYGVMNTFALFSLHESFGLVVAEAMLCELPTVVTAVGGMKHLTIPGETGFQVPRDQPQQAASALQKIVNDRDMAKRMGLAGRKRALAKYTESAYVERVRQLYKIVLNS